MKLSPWILCTCLASLFAFIKRTLFRFRRRRTSDPGQLPVKDPGPGLALAGKKTMTSPAPTVSVPNPGPGPVPGPALTAGVINGPQSVPYENNPHNRSGVDLDWDDWGDGASMSIKIDPTTPSVIGGGPPPSSHPSQGPQAPDEEEPEPDYFTDMTPSYKKPATIRKKTQVIGGPAPLTQGLSNRLTMGVDETAVMTDELGAWSEEASSGWEEETAAGGGDLAWEAEQVIREKRLAERERRAAEQRRKRQEKEAQRSAVAGSRDATRGKLATKLR